MASPSKKLSDVPLIDHADQPQRALDASQVLDTTTTSILHRVVGYGRSARSHPPSAAGTYLVAVTLTYVPLLLVAWLSSLPLAKPSSTLHLPFLYDWNVSFMFLISFPLLLVLTVTDQATLTSSLQQVRADGIVCISDESAASLFSDWKGKFRSINVCAQALGVVIGVAVVAVNYHVYNPRSYYPKPGLGYWTGTERMLPLGFLYLFCIFLFYWLATVYVLRSFAISFFFKDLVAHADIRMMPFHPDSSGGLRPVGHLGLRNQYALTVCGVNLVLLVIVSLRYLSTQPIKTMAAVITAFESLTLHGLIVAAGVAYVTLGPLVFLGPLLPFRTAMLRTKTELMSEVAQRLRIELQRLRKQLPAGLIEKEDEELIDRLRKIGALLNELPVWPFDSGTLKTSLTAYVIPVIGAMLSLARIWWGIK